MFSEKVLLDTAKQSPLAVAAHDKGSWLALFSDDAEVHDPVGSRGHAGSAALERFYETFIAPNSIRFEVEHDIVCGQTVVRDVVIVTRMGGTALTVEVPLFIRYEIVEQQGQPRVRRLYAHWELLPMMSQQVFNQGVATGLSALVKLSSNMLKHQGLSGALGFCHAFVGVGAKAKARSQLCLQAIAHADQQQLKDLLKPDCEILWGHQASSSAALSQHLRGARWEKMLAGGRQVTVRILHAQARYVAQFDFDANGSDINCLRIYGGKSYA